MVLIDYKTRQSAVITILRLNEVFDHILSSVWLDGKIPARVRATLMI